VRAAVVRRADAAEALLASGVPDLKLHNATPNVEGADLEINSNRRDEGLGKVSVISKAEQEARFSDFGVSTDQHLIEKIVFCIRSSFLLLLSERCLCSECKQATSIVR
jgi:hypothetical protein